MTLWLTVELGDVQELTKVNKAIITDSAALLYAAYRRAGKRNKDDTLYLTFGGLA